MATTTTVLAQSKTRRPRQKTDSFADWMARMDTQVEAAARKICNRVPMERVLNGAQRRILEMLAEYLRSLPALNCNESPFDKPGYARINIILEQLFSAKYPDWVARPSQAKRVIADLPNEAVTAYRFLLRNCAGRAPEQPEQPEQPEDDE